MIENPVYKILVSLRVIDPDAIERYAQGVRDNADINVLRCRRSGVIFLDRAVNSAESYYETKEDDSATVETTTGTIPATELEDTERRAKQFLSQIRGKRWVDFGTGRGQILDALKDAAGDTVGVEPNARHRLNLARRGHRVVKSIRDLADSTIDVVTLFHVLEHLPEPVESMRELSQKLTAEGRIIVEVPHARDALLSLFDCEAFRRFTLWSEHLVLHTRESLRAVIEAAGLVCEGIEGYQRFPVSNHLYWLRNGRPGGHAAWSFLDDDTLDRAYATSLTRIDCTDTLIAYARTRTQGENHESKFLLGSTT